MFQQDKDAITETNEHESPETLESKLEPSFSINDSLLPDRVVIEDEIIAEEQTADLLPQPLVVDGLVGELDTVEDEFQLNDLNDPLLAEKELTTQDILDSLSSQDTLALDLGPPDQREESDTTDVSWFGHGQTQQQLLTDQIQSQEQEEAPDSPVSDVALDSGQDQITDSQDVDDRTGLDNEVHDQPPLTEQELVEQEQVGLEFPETIPDTGETQYDQVIGGAYSDEKFEQLKQDFQASLSQRAALETAQLSKEPLDPDDDHQASIPSDEVTKEEDEHLNSRLTHQEELESQPCVSDQYDQKDLFESDELTDQSHHHEQTELNDKLESVLEAESHFADEQSYEDQDYASSEEYVEQSLVLEPESAQDSTMHTELSDYDTSETSSPLDLSDEDLISSQSLSPSLRSLDEQSWASTRPSYFSAQETISTRLLSELSLLESTLESSHSSTSVAGPGSSEQSYQYQIPSTDPADRFPTNLSQHQEPEFSNIEEYLTSLDTPRLLEEFHDQMREEVHQLLLIDDTQTRPDLNESLELVSQGPAIPEPPPYDFLTDLEAQEEANRQSFSTRDNLLWSLKRARFRQEVASYIFALEKNLAQAQFQDPSTNSGRQQASSNRQSTTRRRYPWNDRPQIGVQNQEKIELDFAPNENGIWYHLSYHSPTLRLAGTALVFDALVRNEEQKLEIVNAIRRNNWSQIPRMMEQCAKTVQFDLDPRIFQNVTEEVRRECRVRLHVEPIQTKVLISSISAWEESGKGSYTEIAIRTVNPIEEALISISTPLDWTPVKEVEISQSLYQNFDWWFQEVNRQPEPLSDETLFPSIQRIPFKTEYDYPTFLSPDSGVPNSLEETKLTRAKEVMNVGNQVKASRYFQWQREINPLSDEVRVETGYNTFSLASIKFSIINFNESLRNKKSIPYTGKIKILVRKNLFEDMKHNPYEIDIEDLIHQDGAIEGLLSMKGRYQEGDLIITRTQVTLTEKTRNSKLKSLETQKFGQLDTATYRRPDSVSLILSRRGEISVVVIDNKRTWNEFSHSSSNMDGSGRGQPLRDLPRIIAMIKEQFPEVSEDDIEVSCYTLTARVDTDVNTFVIEGEELIRQVPASKVLNFAGRIATNDSQIG